VFNTYNGTSYAERVRLTEAGNLGINSANPFTDATHTVGNMDVNDVYVRAADTDEDGVADGAWLSSLLGGGRPVEVYRFTQTAVGAGTASGTLARIARPALLVGHQDGASGTVSWTNTPFSSSDLPDVVVRCSSSPSTVNGNILNNRSFKYKLVPANEKSVNFVVIGPSES
jgi:hypothetical protein